MSVGQCSVPCVHQCVYVCVCVCVCMWYGVPICMCAYVCVQCSVWGRGVNLCASVGVFGIVGVSSFQLCGHQ